MPDSPFWLENAGAVYNAGEYRRWLDRLYGNRPGILGAGHLAVSQRGAGANLSVDVAAGAALVKGTENVAGANRQGLYFFNEEAVTNLVVAGGGAAARTDLVVVRFRDSAYSGATNSGVLEIVQGAEGAGAPALPANSYEVARIAVGIGAANIVNANITDRRAVSSPIYAAPWGSSWGELDYVSSAAGQGPTVAANDLILVTGATIAVPAGRILRVFCQARLQLDTALDRFAGAIEESINGGAFAQVGEWAHVRAANNLDRSLEAGAARVVTTASTRRYRMTLTRQGGTGTASTEAVAARPTALQVLDAGPGVLS